MGEGAESVRMCGLGARKVGREMEKWAEKSKKEKLQKLMNLQSRK